MQLSDLKNSERVYEVPFDDTVTVQVRHVSREELRDIYRKATTTRYVGHQKTEDYDPIKGDCLLGRAAIKGWSGVKDGDQEAPCTPDAIDLLMSKHAGFARFINNVVGDVDALIERERDAERKNS